MLEYDFQRSQMFFREFGRAAEVIILNLLLVLPLDLIHIQISV